MTIQYDDHKVAPARIINNQSCISGLGDMTPSSIATIESKRESSDNK